MNKRIDVAILMGSDSDLPVLSSTVAVLDELGLSSAVRIASAHRTPDHVTACVRAAVASGAKVFIAAAGMSAALPGVVAAQTALPVIGVPMEGKTAASLDSLLSVVQMPLGVPVAAVAIGKAGATNAAILAAQIIALSDKKVAKRLAVYRAGLATAGVEKDRALSALGIDGYLKKTGKK